MTASSPDGELEEVPDDSRVFRVVRPEWVKEVDGRSRPSSQAFQNHREDGLMSVYIEDDWADTSLAVEQLLERWGPGYKVCWVRAKDLRELGQEVYRAPRDEEFPGHGAVRHPGGKNRPQRVKSKIAEVAEWYTPNENE